MFGSGSGFGGFWKGEKEERAEKGWCGGGIEKRGEVVVSGEGERGASGGGATVRRRLSWRKAKGREREGETQ